MRWHFIDKPGKKVVKVRENEVVGIGLVVRGEGEYKVRVELVEEGAKALIFGVMKFSEGRAVVLTETVHKHRNTHAETVFAGVLEGGAEAEVKGMIKIDKKSHQVTDFLTEKILLLSREARAIAEPSLEIEADEVRASHAATVAKIDDEQLFYLMSRGLSEEEASKVIERGFLDEVIKKIKNDKIKAKIKEQVYA